MTEHKGLVGALAAFHTEAVRVIKDATAKVTGESKDGGRVSYTYGYADLATVTEAVNPLLGTYGLAFISKPTMTPEGFGLVYKLAHESGETEEGFWPLPDPTRLKPQDMGSWITYWRRYALLAVTNTFPSGEDDDGAKASTIQAMDQHRRGTHREGAEQERPAEPKKEWTDTEIAELHAKIETLPIGQAVNGYDWMASNSLHKRKLVIAADGDGPDGTDPLQVDATEVLAYRMADDAVKPDITLAQVAILRAYAEDRGLLKIQVSTEETLDQVLAEAKGRIERAAQQDAQAADEPLREERRSGDLP